MLIVWVLLGWIALAGVVSLGIGAVVRLRERDGRSSPDVLGPDVLDPDAPQAARDVRGDRDESSRDGLAVVIPLARSPLAPSPGTMGPWARAGGSDANEENSSTTSSTSWQPQPLP